MSLITVEGVEALLDNSSLLNNGGRSSSEISDGPSGNGWDSNWSNPSGMTGDSFNWSPTSSDSSQSFFDTITSAVSDIFHSIGSMVNSISNFFHEVGQTFSGAPGTFFDTGVNPETGLRTDGMPLGYGCGDAKTDAIVPDHFGSANLIKACVDHDNDYSTLGMSKEEADTRLGANISAAVEAAGYSHWVAESVGTIYKAGVQLFGGDAYANAQAEAKAAAGKH